MTGPVVYVERDASGQRLTGLRVVAERGLEERYRVPEEAEVAQAVGFAAQWLRSRLEAQSGAGIGMLCLDPRGSVCSWLDVPSDEAPVVRAAVRQKPAGMWGEWPASAALAGAGTVEALVPAEGSSLQVVGAPKAAASGGLALRRSAPTESRRSAVIGLSDLPVRLLIDELDGLRIGIGRVVTLWQAMALAWDPSAERVDAGGDPLVSSGHAETAVVLVEPSGRVQWVWSSEGVLLAAGSSMLEEGALAGDAKARASGAGRLAVDWLAWTAQLGRSPRRVYCLVDESHGSAEGVGAFGEAVSGVWPGAAVDLMRVEDPVLATLSRLSERTPGGKLRRDPARAGTVAGLSARPGRAHRSMYKWTAGAIAVGALALGALGYQLRGSAAGARAEERKVRSETGALILSELGDRADPVYPQLSLQTMLNETEQAVQARRQLRDVQPVLRAVDDVAFYVGSMRGVQLTRIVVDQPTLLLELETETTEQAETASETLNRAMQGFVNWSRGTMRPGTGGRTRVSITGYWVDGAAAPGSGSGSGGGAGGGGS